MSAPLETTPEPEPDRLESAAAEAIAACGGDMRSAIRALILVNDFLEFELQTKVSQGYTRGVKHGRLHTYAG